MNDYTTKIHLQVKKSFLGIKFQIKSTNNMIIMKATSGNANSGAVIIDRLGVPKITGTIAEDNAVLTIFDTDENRK